jgi:hypothetical protein
MKRWIAFAVVILGLSALTSGGVRPEGVAAYMTCYDDGACVHESIAEHALDLYSNDEILANYGSIDYGVGDEDEEDLVWDHTGACTTITHFWDADNGPDDEVTSVFCNGANAWQKARVLWGMALGEYHSGDLGTAYFYLGHVAHLLADMTVPAHAHEDMHPYADAYEDWMTSQRAALSQEERESLLDMGPVQIPDWAPKLYWLFYTTNQVGDFDASDDYDGDSDDPLGWADFSGLINDPECRSEDGFELGDCNLEVVRSNSYLHAIRATAALYKLFAEESKQQAALTVVIDTVNELECHDDLPIGCESGPDYFVRVGIGGYWFRNEGLQVVNTADIAPGWAFAQNVGLTGTTTVEIELWDEDEDPNPDDPSDIDPRDDDRTLALTVDLAKCVAGEDGAVSGDVGGACGASLASAGEEDDRSQISFHIIAPNAPPTADAGPDQTVDENDVVTLSGSFTDPNVDDTHTFLWHLESSSGTNCVDVPDATMQTLTFAPIDDCVYTFTFTVTDNHGAQGSDTVVVTVVNVPPEANIDKITDELGAQIGVDVPVALVGLEVHLVGSFTDVGIVDTHTASLDWGDGEVYTQADFDSFTDCLGWAIGLLNATHVYAAPGTYTITLVVTDDDGGVGTATAQIEVVDAAGAIAEVVESLAPLADDPNIQAAIDKLQGENDGAASNGALDKLEQGNPNAALEKIKQAIGYLEAAEAADPSLDLTYDKGLLALAGKSVAVGAIAEAEAVAFKPNDLLKIQQAKGLVAEGDAMLAVPDYIGAVDKYQEAVRKVQNIH